MWLRIVDWRENWPEVDFSAIAFLGISAAEMC
jgi:hypothetical protein